MLIALESFLIVFTVMSGAWVALNTRWRKSELKALKQRLGAGCEINPGPPHVGLPALISGDMPDRRGVLTKLAARTSINSHVQRLLETADAKIRPADLVHSCWLYGLGGGILLIFLLPWPKMLAAIPAAVACGSVPIMRLKIKAHRRLAAFEVQFPDGLGFMARSMRAGHAFSVSLEMLYREFDGPMSAEFRRIFEEQNLGMPLDSALERFAARVPLIDVQFFTSAVILHKKTGGNLTEILDKLAQLIRERYQLQGKIRSVSAHGRLTGKVLSSIPVFVGSMMCFVNQEYAKFFSGSTLGHEMLAGALALQLVGYLVIQRIVNIEI